MTSTTTERIRAELYSEDGYQGAAWVRGHTRYIVWNNYVYAREADTVKFVMRNTVAYPEKLLPEKE